MPRHPHIEIDGNGEDGNALALVTAISVALRGAGVQRGEVARFQRDALSGDYGHVLRTSMEWVTLR